MNLRALTAAVIVALPLVGLSSAQAAGGTHVTPIVVHTGGHRCTRTVINGVNDSGVAIGTEFCGVTKAFTRTKRGKVTLYSLPTNFAKYTEAANISSNNILAVDGSDTAKGQLTGYLVSPNGDVTVLNDPKAGDFSTIVDGVNRHGEAVGEYCVDKKCTDQQAFVYNNGNFRDFTFSNPKRVLPSLSEVTDSGAIVGFFYQAPQGYARGFVRSGGKVRIIDVPGASHRLGQGTFLLAAANHGAYCGDLVGAHQRTKGWVQRNGHPHVFDFHPKAKKPLTEVLACNSHGTFGGDTTKSTVPSGFLSHV